MSLFADLPVQRKLGVAILVTSTVTLLVACAVFLTVEYHGYRRSIVHNLATLAQISANNNTAAIAFHDQAAAQQNLAALSAEPQVIGATLYDANGEVFARYSPRPGELLPFDSRMQTGVRLENGRVIVFQPVIEGTRRLGTLYLQGTMEQIYTRMRTYTLIVLGVLAVSFGLAGLLAAMFRRTLALPILELASTASAISAKQDYSLRARQYGRDELGQLTATFNAMLEKTQSALNNLRESEWAHRELVRALPTAAYMCDATGLITIYNQAAVDLWGRVPEIGRESWSGAYKIYRPDGTPLPLGECPMAVALRAGTAVRGVEIIIERPDGTRRNVLPHPEPIRDTSGKLVGIVNMLVDITEQKKGDAAVRQLAAIVESSDDAIIGKDLNGIVITWNRGAERVFGYPATEIIGRPILLLIPDEYQNEEPGILARIRRGERIDHYETIRRRKDGTLINVALTVSPIKDASGKIVGASKIARDITDRKRAERQANFISALTQQLGALTDPEEIVRHASREVGLHLDVDRCYFPELSEGGTAITVKHDWSRPGFASVAGVHRATDLGAQELWQPTSSGSLAINNQESRSLTSNSSQGTDARKIGARATVPFLRDNSWAASIVVTSESPRQWRKNEMDLLENVIGRVWPMVERARSLDALLSSEKRQRELLRALPVPCYVVDQQGRLVLYNQAAATLWGSAPELGTVYWEKIIELDAATKIALSPNQTVIASALLKKQPVRGAETLIVRADGSPRWIVNHPDPIFDAQGNCTGAVNVVIDVTEKRTAHDKVQKAADRLNLAISAARLGDWNWDAATDAITISSRTAEIFGIAPASDLTRSHLRELLHQDDRERALDALKTAMETRTDYDLEYRVIRPDGTERWVAAKGRSFNGPDGKPSGMVGVVQDITERRQQAEELKTLAIKIENQARLFDATLSNLTDLAYAFDRDGRFIFANKPLLELLDRKLEDIVGKKPAELGYPPEIAEQIQHQIQEVIAKKETVRGETSFTDVRGKTDDHEYIYNPVIARDGEVTAVVGSTRIITERKRAEETLRQSEAQLRLVTDNAPVLLVRTDLNHRFTFVNRAYAVRNGFTPAAMIGMKVSDALGEGAFATIEPHMEEALAGARVEFEMEVPYSKLGHRWIHVIYVPEKDARGEITGLLGVITDIGARKEAENELKRARDEAVAASRAKDDFLAALSHELRTPLNPVLLLASDAVNNPKLPSAIRADFDLILKNVNLEARLIDDLLDLTRITRGKLNLDQRACNLHTILQDALSTVEADITAKNIHLTVDLGAARSRVQGDSVRLQQVFWNILKNAAKFTPERGRISVATSEADNGSLIRVQVSDSGIGMTKDEINRVFLAFSQGDHANTGAGIHRFGGLGLGLAISKMLVDLHGGEITAFSEGRDRGSTLQIDLPLALASDGSEVATAKPHPTKTHAPFPFVATNTETGTLHRILLVEDHAPTRFMLQHLLEQRNFEVVVAETSARALSLIEKNVFDLIISDVGLPDRSGYDLMNAVHTIHPDLPGIALSGYGMEDDLARSRAAGFSAHLVKPVTIGMLEEAITTVAPFLANKQNANPLPS